MPATTRPPFEGIDLLVVDGSNLLHLLARGGAPPMAAIGRLRAAVPAAVRIEVVFDGMERGPKGRVATAMHVRYAGRQSGDDVIVELAGTAFERAAAGSRPDPGASTSRVLVVTDDTELRHRLQALGVRTARMHWLLARLDLPRLASPAAGNPRPPGIAPGRPGGGSPARRGGRDEDDEDRPRWKPGRGATTKTGAAHKVPRHRRHPRHPA